MVGANRAAPGAVDGKFRRLALYDLALFDLSKDIAEQNDLRMKLPELYSSLKTELVDHFANINTEYPDAESSEVSHKENPKPKKTAPTTAPRRRSH